MGFILWLIGTICAIWCVMDIFKKPVGIVGKLVMTIVVLATSWFGLIFYYFFARDKVTTWFK
jgi:hypothetical protein